MEPDLELLPIWEASLPAASAYQSNQFHDKQTAAWRQLENCTEWSPCLQVQQLVEAPVKMKRHRRTKRFPLCTAVQQDSLLQNKTIDWKETNQSWTMVVSMVVTSDMTVAGGWRDLQFHYQIICYFRSQLPQLHPQACQPRAAPPQHVS